MRGKWIKARVSVADITEDVLVREVQDEDSLYISRTPVNNIYVHETQNVMFL